MYKIIDYKEIRMTDAEFNYYKQLVTMFSNDSTDGKTYFKDLFEVDQDGFIILIKTNKSVPWAILFFIQQLMLSQRIRLIDNLLNKVNRIEDRMNEIDNNSKKVG